MAPRTLLTLEQFERLPADGMRHELDQGELIVMPPHLGRHGKIEQKVARILGGFLEPRGLGTVFVETGFRLRPDTVRAPDISFVRAAKINEADLDSRFGFAPDLAVAVISPSGSAGDIARKVEQYVSAGSVVWLLYPKQRTVHVYESKGRGAILSGDDALESPALLPEFSVRVSEFFV